MTGTLTSLGVLSLQFTGLVSQGVGRGGNDCVWVCMCVRWTLDSTPTSTSSPDTSNKTKQAKVLCCVCVRVCVSECVCVHMRVWKCAQKKRDMCGCRVVAAVTNLPGLPDGSRSKVTELWLDKHRSPASISHPVHFGNTWLFLGALGP